MEYWFHLAKNKLCDDVKTMAIKKGLNRNRAKLTVCSIANREPLPFQWPPACPHQWWQFRSWSTISIEGIVYTIGSTFQPNADLLPLPTWWKSVSDDSLSDKNAQSICVETYRAERRCKTKLKMVDTKSSHNRLYLAVVPDFKSFSILPGSINAILIRNPGPVKAHSVRKLNPF